MLNLILSNFSSLENKFIRDLVACIDGLQIIEVQDDHGALKSTELGMTIAVISRWTDYPTDSQLETVSRLAKLRIPSIPLIEARLLAGSKLAAIEAGAVDCLGMETVKPRLALLLEMFASRGKLFAEDIDFKVERMRDAGLLFSSPEMKELLIRLSRVAHLGSTILLSGETGVGKSTLARWIHQQSARNTKPFVDVPCGALPPNLVESELFGHLRGSFTSADRDHSGKFSVCDKGTLLLDEVDCLPLEVQGKLLRAVERREFEKVGSTETERFEARLIVATNRPLEQEVAAGRFRSDLFYRLGVLSFRIPSLRERSGAVTQLADKFCEHFARLHNRRVTGLSPAAMASLQEYTWPGNVRELRNALDYAVAVSTGALIQWHDLPEPVRNPTGINQGLDRLGAHGVQSAGRSNYNQDAAARCAAERDLLISTLKRNNNNRTRTAADLGISRVTLYKRLERHHIDKCLAIE